MVQYIDLFRYYCIVEIKFLVIDKLIVLLLIVKFCCFVNFSFVVCSIRKCNTNEI